MVLSFMQWEKWLWKRHPLNLKYLFGICHFSMTVTSDPPILQYPTVCFLQFSPISCNVFQKLSWLIFYTGSVLWGKFSVMKKVCLPVTHFDFSPTLFLEIFARLIFYPISAQRAVVRMCAQIVTEFRRRWISKYFETYIFPGELFCPLGKFPICWLVVFAIRVNQPIIWLLWIRIPVLGPKSSCFVTLFKQT